MVEPDRNRSTETESLRRVLKQLKVVFVASLITEPDHIHPDGTDGNEVTGV
jgi:hypothetical protein